MIKTKQETTALKANTISVISRNQELLVLVGARALSRRIAASMVAYSSSAVEVLPVVTLWPSLDLVINTLISP